MSSYTCSSSMVPKVATASDWVSPRVNSAEPCGRGSTPISQVMGRISSVPRPSTRTPLSRMLLRKILYSMSSKSASNNFFCASSSSCSAYFSAKAVFTDAIASRRSCLPFTKQAFSICGSASASIASLFSRATCSGESGSFSFPARARSSSCKRHIAAIKSCAFSKAPSITSSDTSFAPPSTIVKPSAVPATTISISPFSICS